MDVFVCFFSMYMCFFCVFEYDAIVPFYSQLLSIKTFDLAINPLFFLYVCVFFSLFVYIWYSLKPIFIETACVDFN